jgi:ribonuclease P protein component
LTSAGGSFEPPVPFLGWRVPSLLFALLQAIMSNREDRSSAPDQRLRKAERLTRRAEFLEAQRAGGRYQGTWLVVYAMATKRGFARLGITTSRKVGNAVVRNRWRRLIREAFRHNKAKLPASHDLVVIVRAQHEAPALGALAHDLIRAAQRAATPRKKEARPDKQRASDGPEQT